MGIVLDIRYFPGGKYKMAFLVVEPLHFSPHRPPLFIAALMAFVSSYLAGSLISIDNKRHVKSYNNNGGRFADLR